MITQMCMFKAKAEDEIRQEVIDDLKGDNEDFNQDDHTDQINRITERRLKDEKFKTSVHKSKEDKKEELAELKKAKAEVTPKGEQKPKGEETGKETTLTLKETKALIDVHDDDVEEILDYAKYKGITASDAKQTGHIKTYLSERAEERKTAEASNTGGGKRGTSKVSGATLLQKANDKGELPDSDADLDSLLEERYKT